MSQTRRMAISLAMLVLLLLVGCSKHPPRYARGIGNDCPNRFYDCWDFHSVKSPDLALGKCLPRLAVCCESEDLPACPLLQDQTEEFWGCWQRKVESVGVDGATKVCGGGEGKPP